MTTSADSAPAARPRAVAPPHLRRPEHHTWRLFVDEAGQFDNARDEVACAALLVTRAAGALRPDQIAASLRAAAPELAWPLHTTYFSRPVLFALVPRAASAHVPAVREALAARDADTLRAVTDALAARREPNWTALTRLDAILREEHPALYRALEDRVNEVRVLIRRLLTQLAPAGRVMLFAASERRRVADVPPDATTSGAFSRRYDEVLAALLGGVARSLRHAGGTHHVFVQALVRDTFDQVLQKRRDLFVTHVAATISRAVPPNDVVRLVVEDVPAYRHDTHPSLVLADYAATRSRPALASASLSLAAVERTLECHFALPVRSGDPARTHLAGAERFGDAPPTAVKRWALDVDAEWAS